MNRQTALLGIAVLSASVAVLSVSACSRRSGETQTGEQAPPAAATDPNATANTGATAPTSGAATTATDQTPTAADAGVNGATAPNSATGQDQNTASTGKTTDPQTTNPRNPPDR
jgi:hypothetical protein